MKKKIVSAYMWIIVLPVLMLGIYIVLASFSSNKTFTMDSFSIRQYIDGFWNNSDFWFYFWNSVVVSGAILIGTLIVAVTSSYALAKLKIPFKKLLLMIIILWMMIPYQVVLAPQLLVIDKMSLLDTRTSVILPNIFTTFGVYLLYQFVCKIPDECLEAAQLDGAGRLKILTSIVIPQVKEGISALVILNVMETWNIVEQPLFFIENEFKRPLSVILSESDQLAAENVFAGCVVFMIPIFLIFLICKDSLIEGIQNTVVVRKEN